MTLVRVTPDNLIYAVDLVAAITGRGINQSHRYLNARRYLRFSASRYKKHANRKLLTPDAAIQLIL